MKYNIIGRTVGMYKYFFIALLWLLIVNYKITLLPIIKRGTIILYYSKLYILLLITYELQKHYLFFYYYIIQA